jgi:DNA end-binding protein Ku
LEKDVKIRPQEVQMAQTLIENLSDEWDPTAFRDEYREALLEIVEKKAAGEEITVVEEAEPTKVVDLMEALKASVEAAKKGKGAAEEEEEAPAAKSGARKRTTASRAKKTATTERKRKAG